MLGSRGVCTVATLAVTTSGEEVPRMAHNKGLTYTAMVLETRGKTILSYRRAQHSSILGWSFAIFLAFATPPACNAQLIPFSGVQAYACVASSLPVSLPCDILFDPPLGSSFSPPLHASYNLPNARVQMSVDDTGAASYGVLRASTSDTFTISGSPLVAYTKVDAQFQDIITISFPPFDGQPGILFLRYKLRGTTSATGLAGAEAYVIANVSGPGLPANQFCVSGYSSPLVGGIFLCPVAFQFTYGQPFALYFDLGSASGTFKPNSTGSGGLLDTAKTAGQGAGTANFSNTFVLSGIEAFDVNGNPLPSAPTITSASGTVYSVNGILKSFAAFSVRGLNLNETRDAFRIEGKFKLAEDSNSIDPLTQDVALQVGTFSTVISAGSFHLKRAADAAPEENEERYIFEGTINGVALEFQIDSLGDNKFNFKVRARDASLTGTMAPVEVRLIVGLFGGTTLAEGDLD